MSKACCKHFIPVCLCLLMTVSSLRALIAPTEELYSNLAIPVAPVLYGTRVLFEDFTQGTYRFYLVDIHSKTRSELRDNLTKYIWPYDFSGTHAGWITFSSSSGGGIPIGGNGGIGDPGGIPIPGASAAYKVQIIDINSKIIQDVSSDSAYKDFMAMDDQSIVWTDYRHTTSTDTFNEIYFSSLSSINPTRITETVSFKASGDILGDLIVWQDYRNAGSNTTNADIYLFDRSGSGEKAICTNTSYQDQPSINDKYVVWQDYRNAGNGDNADIFMYNLSTNQETAICTAPGYQGNPKVYGDYVVWHDYRNVTTQDSTNADIYLCQISTGTEIPLTNKSGFQGPPSIYDSKIVWYDYTDNKLYVATINGVPQSIKNRLLSSGQLKNVTAETAYFDLLGKKIMAPKTALQSLITIQTITDSKPVKRIGYID